MKSLQNLSVTTQLVFILFIGFVFAPANAICEPLAAPPSNGTPLPAETPLSAAISQTLKDSPDFISVGGVAAVPKAALIRFYESRQFQPLWVGADSINNRGDALLSALHNAASEGLNPADYLPTNLVIKPGDVASAAHVEIALSAAFCRYASHLRSGQLWPQEVDSEYVLTPPTFDPEAALDGVSKSPSVDAYLRSMAPTDPIYIGLRLALHEYRDIAAAGGWGTLPSGPSLKPGQSDSRVITLRRILTQTKDYAGPHTDSALYDEALAKGVRHFQNRHGLEPDAAVGPGTVAAINVPVADRIRQIIVNMERWRWMPRDLGDTHILVNMAGYQLDVFQGGRTALNMRVVVGMPLRRTPVFSNAVSYIEFNPYWTVPKTIAVEEMLPKLRANPDFLASQGFRIYGPNGEVDPNTIDWSAASKGYFPYKLRQNPGDRNALGRIKFMFPNQFAVYLHDTPSRRLFSRAKRALSHGCIRVEKPVELAEFLLRDEGNWSRARVEQAIDSNKNRSVRLSEPVPIYLIDLTAWRDEDGTIEIRDDLYGRDARLLRVLFKDAA